MRRLIATATVVLAALIWPLAPAAGEEHEQQEADRTVTVEATDFEFSPDEIEMEASTTLKVTLINEGNVAHSFAVPELGQESERIQPGKETTLMVSPEEPGTYQIVCQVPGHEQAGMTATLVVE